MSHRRASTHGLVGLMLSVTLSLSAVKPVAQSKSASQSTSDTSAEPVPVVVDSVEIDGGPELSADEKSAIANGLQGETSHSDWLNRLSAKATKQLQNDGCLDGSAVAKVESTRLTDGKEHVTVSVAVTAGTRYTIQKVWWTGSSIFSQAQLDNLSLLRVGDVFRPSTLSRSVGLLMQAYSERGYREISLDPQFRKFPESGKVAIYLEVIEGQNSGDEKPLQCKQYSTEDIQSAAYVPSSTYDPAIDGQMQIARAELEARRTRKKVLLIVGGKWCGWCRVLDQTFQKNPAASELRDNLFIAVHVNVSEENGNECALRSYPKPPGFPFVYVLDATGALLGTGDTTDWESGDGYDPQRIESFLKKW
jgi:hypothetical protein